MADAETVEKSIGSVVGTSRIFGMTNDLIGEFEGFAWEGLGKGDVVEADTSQADATPKNMNKMEETMSIPGLLRIQLI